MRSSTLLRLVVLFFALSPLFAHHVVRREYSWPKCTQSCLQNNVHIYGASNCGSAATSSICICPNEAAAIALHGCLVDNCTIYDQFVEAEGAFQAFCAVQLDPLPLSLIATSSATSSTTSAVAHLETDHPSPTSSASSHSSLSRTATLAISIALGLCAITAGVLVFLSVRRRRSRAGRWARSESNDGQAVKEYHGGDAAPQVHGSQTCRGWRRGEDTAPTTLNQGNPFDDDAASPDRELCHPTESLDGSSVDAQHGSDMGERDTTLPSRRKHSCAAPTEDPFADPQGAVTLPQDQDIADTRLWEDRSTMVLLRVPLGVAKRVLAAMHARRSGELEGEVTERLEEAVRRDSETLPAYSSPSSLELDRSEPSQT